MLAPAAKVTLRILYKLLGTVVAIGIMAFAMKQRADLTDLQRTGRIATVTSVTDHREPTRGRYSRHSATITFVTSEGFKVQKHQSFPAQVAADFQINKPVHVFYSPDDPHTFVFAKDEPGNDLLVVGFLVLMAVVLLG